MHVTDAIDQRSNDLSGRLHQQEGFVFVLDLPLPPEDGADQRDDVHAGRQLPFDDDGRDLVRLVRRARDQDDHRPPRLDIAHGAIYMDSA